jgi:hypothetical protein
MNEMMLINIERATITTVKRSKYYLAAEKIKS